MVKKFDIYFKKLNITSKEVSLSLVEDLQKKHIEHFSFNSIAVLLGNNISLKIEDILEKIVVKNRGGYCFEHNALMYEVLKILDFNVRILMAKVMNNKEVDTPRTHRITLLRYDNKEYIVDVGFGPLTPQKVLDIHHKGLQDGYRIIMHNENTYQLEVQKGDDFFYLYRFDLAHYTQADCIMGNFYSSMYPHAIFANNFIISLRLKSMTLSLRNNVYYRIGNENTEIIDVNSVRILKDILNNDFKIFLHSSEYKYLFESNRNVSQRKKMNIEIITIKKLNTKGSTEMGYVLNEYAKDPMGGGEALPLDIQENVALKMSQIAHSIIIMAYVEGEVAGLITAFENFSTFKCKPLLNIHDIIVLQQFRGLGISQMMLEEIEIEAKKRDCCKITLEVLEGNEIAQKSYIKFGFRGYELDSQMGKALFWEKAL